MKSLFKSSSWKSWQEIKTPIHLPNLELISIHVEKTAGTSFYHELKQQYGEHGVLRMDTHQHDIPYFNQQKEINLQSLDEIKVLHGHFLRSDLDRYLQFDWAQVKLICWLRDPAQRILSNYNHLCSRLKDYVDSNKSPQLIEKMMKSFQEFVGAEINQNRMAMYLDAYRPTDFAFVGEVENYSDNLKRLAQLLNWDEAKINYSKLNDSSKVKQEITSEESAFIRSMNTQDYKIYELLKRS